MFDPTDHQNEQALMQQLRASGDHAAQQQATTLQGLSRRPCAVITSPAEPLNATTGT